MQSFHLGEFFGSGSLNWKDESKEEMTQMYEPRHCAVLVYIVKLTERNGAQSSMNATC